MSAFRLPASESNIDLWLAFYDEIVDETLLCEFRNLLTGAERAQEARFYFPVDRKRYLVTRAMVRTVLSLYADIAPRDWMFTANAFGRPEIANEGAETLGLCFNISHTAGLIALGITRHRALGIDVENITSREVSNDLAAHFFAPAEAAELARVPPARYQERFFEYWTFKESYIKACGKGLSIPLDQFAFAYPHACGVSISIRPELGDTADRWCFWQFRPTSRHLLAVCAERRNIEPVFTIRKVVPAVMDTVLDLKCLRTSELSECRY